LLKESGLPGPRGNIELAQVVANEGNRRLFQRYITYTAEEAPVNSPYEFLTFCGIVGLGRLLAEGDTSLIKTLHQFASDPRWRIREGVAIALQRLGDVNMERLIAVMREWGQGTALEQRAAAAALCEPRLLGRAQYARAVLGILDQITMGIEQVENRRSDDFLTLRKGLGYCWSVAVVALPIEGKALMEKWMDKSDKDVRWIMKENLKKARLVRMDADWVKKWRGKDEHSTKDDYPARYYAVVVFHCPHTIPAVVDLLAVGLVGSLGICHDFHIGLRHQPGAGRAASSRSDC